MATKNIQFRVEDELKKKAEKVLDDLGLDLPTALRLFLKKIVKTKSIPFKIGASDSDEYSAEQIKEILLIVRDAKQGKNVSRKFDDVEELIASLKK